MDTIEIPIFGPGIEVRQTNFKLWVENVRDPANESSEGVRKLSVVNDAAVAQYEIAPLPNERWAISICCSYECGNYSGLCSPWTDFSSREECVEHFLRTARRHFRPLGCREITSLQQQAQKEMVRQLADGLFGFIEPTPQLNSP